MVGELGHYLDRQWEGMWTQRPGLTFIGNVKWDDDLLVK